MPEPGTAYDLRSTDQGSPDQSQPLSTMPTSSASKDLPETGSSAEHLANTAIPPAQSTSVSLTEAIKRGWDWVVFVWRMLQRLGGPLEVLRTFGMIISILVTRLLTQMGLFQKTNKRRP
jgi:hypothetical protein